MSRRRGRGEGSISQRPDGSWLARIDLGWRDGKRRRKIVSGPTRKAVATTLVTLLNDVQEGSLLPDERLTVAQFLTRWLTYRQPKMRPRSWATYEQIVRLHLIPAIGNHRLARLQPMHLEEWMRDATKKGVSARAIRYARTVLRTALNQARKWQLLRQNVATLIDPPRYTPKPIRPLTPTYAKRLIATAKGHRLGALVTVGAALGLRIGEAIALRWKEDLDLDGRVLRVQQALERSGGDAAARRRLIAAKREVRVKIAATPKRTPERRDLWIELERLRKEWRTARTQLRVTEPKSARSRRTLSLPAIAVTALKQHRTRQRRERLVAGRIWQESGYVFTSPIGTALDPRNALREFHALCRAANVPVIRLHDLRHTAATLLLAQGVDPRTIMETLGHSQISLTMNTYAHVVPALQVDAAARMDAILR